MIDIPDVWDTKIDMLLQHHSQQMPGPEYDSGFEMPKPEQLPIVHAARVMSEFRGLACGARYGEAFRWWRAANRIVSRRLLP